MSRLTVIYIESLSYHTVITHSDQQWVSYDNTTFDSMQVTDLSYHDGVRVDLSFIEDIENPTNQELEVFDMLYPNSKARDIIGAFVKSVLAYW